MILLKMFCILNELVRLDSWNLKLVAKYAEGASSKNQLQKEKERKTEKRGTLRYMQKEKIICRPHRAH